MKISNIGCSGLAATLAIVASSATFASEAIPARIDAAKVTHILKLDDGEISYDDTGGTGPAVICVPGIGDLRGQYRFVAPIFVAAGFRVITMDLHGLGDSSTDWPDYSAASVGKDIVALIRQLGIRTAFIAGNSMAGAAALWASAEIPGNIAGIVLLDPFVRDMPATISQRLLMPILGVALLRPWGPSFWSMYYGSLYKSAPPADLAAYRFALAENLKQSGRIEATKAMMFASKESCEARIPEVRARVLVVMGTRDPDFGDPAAEAGWVASHLHGKVLMVEGAGHYPHVEYPDVVANATIEFMRGASSVEANRR
jgi:pimeloyl-ACP methyl ester carboxylesterase